jgi:hypothetical protein
VKRLLQMLIVPLGPVVEEVAHPLRQLR